MIIWTDDRVARVEALLPPPPPPAASYVPVREAGGFLYVAGQTPHVLGELSHRGNVGTIGQAVVTPETARELARGAALNSLAALKHYLGDLRQLESIVSLTGFIACGPEFRRHPWVIDGASETLVELLGSGGEHARAAVGVSSLPDGAPVELSLIAFRGA